MRPIQFIYFDVGNVLLRFDHMWNQVIGIVGELSPEALEIKNELVIKLMKGKITYMDYWDRLGKGAKIRQHFPQYEDYLVSGFTIIEETHQLIARLSTQYNIGLFTNVASGVNELNSHKGKIPDIAYRAIIKSCDIGFVKPEKEIFEIAQKAAQCEPAQILLIDDIEVNVAIAREQGWNAIQFNPHNVRDSIEEIQTMLSG